MNKKTRREDFEYAHRGLAGGLVNRLYTLWALMGKGVQWLSKTS